MPIIFFWRKLRLGLVVMVGLATLLACSRSEYPGVAPDDGSPANNDLLSVPPSIAPGAVVTDGTRFDLPDLVATLATLDSYELEMVLSFSGQDSTGKSLNWQLTSQVQVMVQQAARRFDLQVNGLDDDSQLQAVSAAQIGSESYVAVPGVGCLGGRNGSMNLGQAGPAAPATYLSAILGAELVAQGEPLSGIYRFDEAALPAWPAGPVQVDGQLSVAAETGFPNHIELTARGPADYLGLGQPQDGTLQLALDILRVNSLGPIEPPADCLGAVIYPMVGDAFAITTVDKFVSFESHQPLSDIVAFYQAQMPAAGWIESEEAVILTDEEPVALLTFQHQGTTVTISISQNLGSGVTTVLITP